MPCRLNRKREWVARLMLESHQHEASFFVTLTYREQEGLSVSDGCVSKRDVQLWLKRLLKATGRSFRYYVVGEYGDENGRPHYHALLFGLPGGTVQLGTHIRTCQCVICKSWQAGKIFVGTVTPESVAYVVDYTIKSRESAKAGPGYFPYRCPEFGLMSRKPGIGAGAASSIAESVRRSGRELSPPRVLRFGKRKLPLGRFLREKVDEAIGDGTMRLLRRFRRDVARSVDEFAMKRAFLLSTPEGRAQHEEKRLQSSRRAEWRESVKRGKKGIA